MAELHEQLHVLEHWVTSLQALHMTIKSAIDCQLIVERHDQAVQQAQARVDALKQEEDTRTHGLELFLKHAEEARARATQIADHERLERVALREHEAKHLQQVQFEVEKTQRSLDAVRQKHRIAEEKLEKLYASLNKTADGLDVLAGRAGRID